MPAGAEHISAKLIRSTDICSLIDTVLDAGKIVVKLDIRVLARVPVLCLNLGTNLLVSASQAGKELAALLGKPALKESNIRIEDGIVKDLEECSAFRLEILDLLYQRIDYWVRPVPRIVEQDSLLDRIRR